MNFHYLNIIKKDTAIFKILLGLLVCSTVIFLPIFFDGAVTAKHLAFQGSSLLIILFSLKFIRKDRFFTIDQITLVVLLVYGTILIRKALENLFFLQSLTVQSDIALIALFFILKQLFSYYNSLYNFCLQIFKILCILLSMWGILQSVEVLPHFNNYFKVTGPFDNPGPYSCTLAILLSIHIAQLFSKKPKQSFFNYLIILAGIYALISSEIRTAIIAILVVSFFLVIKNFSRQLRSYFFFNSLTKRLVITSLIFVSIVFYMSFAIKKNSSLGRILIWKISLLENHNPIFGGGYSYFSQKYNLLQSEYFSKNADLPNMADSKLAGNVSYCYNEFIEIFLNYGIPGILFIIFFVYQFSKGFYNARNNSPPEFSIAFWGIVCFLILCFFSYPLSIISCKTILIICLAYFSNFTDQFRVRKTISLTKLFWILQISLVICYSYIYISNIYSFRKLYRIESDFKKYFDTEAAIIGCEKIENNFQGYDRFLILYGKILFLHKNYLASLKVLQRARAVNSDPLIFYTTGQSYSELNNKELAEINFQKAIFIMPTMLYPRFLLLNHYLKFGDIDNALAQATTILNISVKVESPATREIKKYAHKIVDHYSGF